mgnify:CR=1 FL=1
MVLEASQPCLPVTFVRINDYPATRALHVSLARLQFVWVEALSHGGSGGLLLLKALLGGTQFVCSEEAAEARLKNDVLDRQVGATGREKSIEPLALRSRPRREHPLHGGEAATTAHGLKEATTPVAGLTASLMIALKERVFELLRECTHSVGRLDNSLFTCPQPPPLPAITRGPDRHAQ